MKVGILTLPLHTNYGGILQAYALQTVLKRMGHEAILLDRNWIELSQFRKILSDAKWMVRSIFLRKKQIAPYKVQEAMGKNIKAFILKEINPRVIVKQISDIQNLHLDAIVVGSDQVWRRHYTPNIAFYYLDFAQWWGVKRIAYAASFGIKEWDYSPKETEKCKQLLNLFDGVSLREESGKKLCSQFLGRKDTKVVLDPTFLLEASDYQSLIVKVDNSITGDLLCYILDPNAELQTIIDKTANYYKYKPYYTNIGENTNFNSLSQYIKPSIEYWLKGFIHAKFVITDSFHGCVFSILFNKPFLVYGNKNRGLARFESLLSQLGLSNRLASSHEDISNIIKADIDWDLVNERLKFLRTDSYSFLKIHLMPN